MHDLKTIIPHREKPMKFDDYHRECKMCFNSGWTETTRHDVIGRPYRGVIKCFSCEYWKRWSEKHTTKQAA